MTVDVRSESKLDMMELKLDRLLDEMRFLIAHDRSRYPLA
jgi:hypothetical protein